MQFHEILLDFHGKYSKKILEIAFGSFKLFPSSKIDLWPFLKWQKMDFGQKNFVKLIYLIFWPGLF